MTDVTNLLIALGFVIIGLAFLISYFIIRSGVVKLIKETLAGKAQDSLKNSKLIIEKTKQLVWFLGISYVTIALSLFFEGLSGVIDSSAVVAAFVVVGALLLVYGVMLTAFGILAMYHNSEQKYGKMEKAVLKAICNLDNGKKLYVFVPDGSFGADALNGINSLDEKAITSYANAGGNVLDCCVLEETKALNIGVEYLLYVNTLRVRTCGVNVTFFTAQGIEALVNKKQEKETQKAVVKEQSTATVAPVSIKQPKKPEVKAKPVQPKQEKPKTKVASKSKQPEKLVSAKQSKEKTVSRPSVKAPAAKKTTVATKTQKQKTTVTKKPVKTTSKTTLKKKSVTAKK